LEALLALLENSAIGTFRQMPLDIHRDRLSEPSVGEVVQ